MKGLKVTIKQTGKGLKSFFKALNSELLIGILPEESANTPPDEMSNAEKMYINSQGSPAQNIPPRPIIEPVVDRMFISASGILSEHIEGALQSNDFSELIRFYRTFGSQCVKAIKADFKSPTVPRAKNSEETEENKEGATPLIDTGKMMKAISFKIVNKLE